MINDTDLFRNNISDFVDQNVASLISPIIGSISNIITSVATSCDTLRNGADKERSVIQRRYIYIYTGLI